MPLRAYCPALHGALGFVAHPTESSHATQLPLPSQKPPGHAPPSATLVAESTHAGAPPTQVCVPVLQGLGFAVHALPAEHATQPPAPSQTLPAPHGAPEPRFVVASAQTGAPLEQSMMPSRHAVGFEVQGAEAVHATQPPSAAQTSSVPQLEPFAFG
jgi:hypothetical protein